MNREIVNPDHENGDVDWEDAEHEDEDRVGVVVEIMVGWRSLHIGDQRWLLDKRMVLLTFSLRWREAPAHVASWTMQETR